MDVQRKYKQLTFGSWRGFTKTVKHNNKNVPVKLDEATVLEDKNVFCSFCPKRFKSNGNLAVHLKCKHNGEQKNLPSTSSDPKDTVEETVPLNVTASVTTASANTKMNRLMKIA